MAFTRLTEEKTLTEVEKKKIRHCYRAKIIIPVSLGLTAITCTIIAFRFSRDHTQQCNYLLDTAPELGCSFVESLRPFYNCFNTSSIASSSSFIDILCPTDSRIAGLSLTDFLYARAEEQAKDFYAHYQFKLYGCATVLSWTFGSMLGWGIGSELANKHIQKQEQLSVDDQLRPRTPFLALPSHEQENASDSDDDIVEAPRRKSCCPNLSKAWTGLWGRLWCSSKPSSDQVTMDNLSPRSNTNLSFL